MASKKPFVRQIAWLSILPQLFFMGLLALAFGLAITPFSDALMYAMLTYLIISLTLRFGIAHNHRKGISFCKAGNYDQAISEFKKSYDFFSKHAWLDKYRYIALLSSSRISFTEMALINIAFCSSQIGNGLMAKQYYKKALEQFPKSEIAKTTLNLISSIENQTTE